MSLLLSLLLLLSAHQAFAGADAGPWWCDAAKCYHEDYAYIEAIIIVMLVALAVLFDGAHHYLEHVADHSYWYGKLQSVAGSHEEGHASSVRAIKYRTPLFKHWVNRLSMEFMVLGFLAFFIFVSREAGFFEWIVDIFPPNTGNLHLPKTPEDWLHMVEIVHMKLFLGMIVYFLLVLRVVNGCTKHAQFWEEMRILRRTSRSESSWELQERTDSDVLGHTRLQRYSRWRLYFVKSVMTWRETRPKLYEETLRHLGIWSSDTPSQSRFQRTLDDNFPFSAYLAYSVRACCKDTVDIHRITWAAVIVLFTIFALLHRHAKLLLLHVMPVFIVGAFLLLFGVSRLNRIFRQRVESAGSKAVHTADAMEDAERSTSLSVGFDLELGQATVIKEVSKKSLELQEPTEGFHERYSTELWVFRMLQIVLFVLSYSCARTIGDANDWRNHPKEVLAVSSGFMVLFLVLGSLLPKYVPNFAALMAMPPYCDQINVETFFQVLDEYAPEHRGKVARECFPAPCRVGQRPENSSSSSLGSMPVDTAIEQLTKQQRHLAGQVREVQSFLKMTDPEKVPDVLGFPQQLVSADSLKRELSMMRAQLSRFGTLMQSHLCPNQVADANVETPKSFMETVSVCLSPDSRSKTLSGSHMRRPSSRDLQFFGDPLCRQVTMKIDRHVHYAESPGDEDSALDPHGGVVN